MTLHERIKTRREELGYSQDELAKLLGYKSRSTITKIESGENDITQSKIVAFAKALNVSPSYLMGWDEPPTSTIKLTPSEEMRIKKYRALDERGKKHVDIVLDFEYQDCKDLYEEQEEKKFKQEE